MDEPTLQRHIRNRVGQAFHWEYAAILREFYRVVTQAREKLAGKDTRSPTERWLDARLRCEGLIAETVGPEDDPECAARMIPKGLSQRPDTDPLLIKPLLKPNAEAPAITVQDAAHVYARDKVLNEDKDDTAQWRSWVSNTGSPSWNSARGF